MHQPSGMQAAFPVADIEQFATGMTLRDWFATHAPSRALPLERIVPSRPLPPMPEHWSKTEFMLAQPGEGGVSRISLVNAWRGWGDWLEDDSIPPKVLEEFKAYDRQLAERNAAIENDAARADADAHARWAYEYADAMLRAREQ